MEKIQTDLLSIIKRVDYFLAVVLVLLLSLSIFSYKSKITLKENSALIAETNSVLLELKGTLASMEEAESGVNSFLLAEDPEFLNLYHTKTKMVGDHLKKLGELISTNEDQFRNLQKLHGLIVEKLKQLEFIIQFRKSKQYSRDKLEPYVTQGALIMTDMRKLIATTETRERALLAEDVAEANRLAERSSFTILFSCAMAFFLLFIGRMVLSRHIKERRNTEVAFRKTTLALENAVEGISQLDREGVFRSVNKAFASVLGLEFHEILGKTWGHLLNVENNKKFLIAYDKLKTSGREEVELETIHKGGGKLYVRLTMVVNRDSRGEFDGLYCFIKDITVERVEHQQLVNARKVAQEASVAKSEFLANMSHEIRTPMNGVIGMTSLLIKTPLNPQQIKYVDTINVSAQALLTLINDILDFSKIESRKIVLESIDFDVFEVFEDAKKMFIHSARAKNIDLKFEFASGVPQYLKGDPGKLRQILINLIGNAVKFTSKGGVSVSVSLQSEMSGFVELRVEVQDTGIGLSMDGQSRLFKPFSQADSSTTRKYGGTGLGLAICKRLVEIMSGEIGVTSEEGVGSTFHFTLRMPRGKAVEKKQIEMLPMQVPSANTMANSAHTILVVEDNLVNQKVAMEMIGQMGFQTEAAENGKVAIEMFQKKTYIMILMDCQMSVMDGFEATQKIRTFEEVAGGHVPIVALTANVTSADKQRCFDAGMDDYLNKPIEFGRLVTTINKWTSDKVKTSVPAPQPQPPPEEKIVSKTELMDWEKLKVIKGFQKPGAKDLAAELIQLYLETSPSYLKKIKVAIDGKDHEQLREQAHGLKGSSVNLGIEKVGQLSKELEDAGKEGRISAATTETYNQLVEAYDQSEVLLLDFMKNGGQAA